MSVFRSNQGFFESPYPATYFFLAANIVIFGLCANQFSGTQFPHRLFQNAFRVNIRRASAAVQKLN